jgi:DNA helicase-2/ATP-dependent DNA helicase PcrA
MTRARDHLHCYVPLRFHFRRQRRNGDVHGYAQRSRFLTEAVVAEMDTVSVDPPAPTELEVATTARAVADVDAMLGALLD